MVVFTLRRDIKMTDLISRWLTLILLGLPMLAISEPRLLFSEDFETGVNNAEILDGGVITDHMPSSGSFSARVNLFEGSNDPLVKFPENRSTVRTTSTAVRDNYPEVLYISYDFRFDDALWRKSDGQPYSWGGGTQSDIAVLTKGGYYGKYREIVQQGFYLVWGGGPNGRITFGDNSSGGQAWDSSWNERDWSPGGKLIYLKTGHPFGANGKWNKFEMELDHSGTQDYIRAKIWVNGHAAKDERYAPDSNDNYFRLPRGFVVEQFSTSYASPQDLSNSKNRGGYAGGLQIDNISVWAGSPKSRAPTPPVDISVE